MQDKNSAKNDLFDMWIDECNPVYIPRTFEQARKYLLCFGYDVDASNLDGKVFIRSVKDNSKWHECADTKEELVDILRNTIISFERATFELRMLTMYAFIGVID